MENKITWVELQEQIKIIFDKTELKLYEDVLQKDPNGWNWVLSFHNLRTESALIIHTKLIFKLDESKTYLRRNEFLYLYELDCIFKLVRFDTLGILTDKINDIISNDRFGTNLLTISKFMISPAMTINEFLYSNKIVGYSIFDFDYEPKIAITPCQNLSLDFGFNVNNIYDVTLSITKEKGDRFVSKFSFNDIESITESEDLSDLDGTISLFIQKNIEPGIGTNN